VYIDGAACHREVHSIFSVGPADRAIHGLARLTDAQAESRSPGLASKDDNK